LRERLAALEHFSPGAPAGGPRRRGRPARAAEASGEIHGLRPAVEAGGEGACPIGA
jgi:hypothetical protein